MAFLPQWTVGPALGPAQLYRPLRPGKAEPHPLRLSGCPPGHPDPVLQEPGDPPLHGGIWGGALMFRLKALLVRTDMLTGISHLSSFFSKKEKRKRRSIEFKPGLESSPLAQALFKR